MSTCNLRTFRAKPRQSGRFIANQKQNLIYILVQLSAVIALPVQKAQKDHRSEPRAIAGKTLTNIQKYV